MKDALTSEQVVSRMKAWLKQPVGRYRSGQEERWKLLLTMVGFLAFLAVFSYVAEIYG